MAGNRCRDAVVTVYPFVAHTLRQVRQGSKLPKGNQSTKRLTGQHFSRPHPSVSVFPSLPQEVADNCAHAFPPKSLVLTLCPVGCLAEGWAGGTSTSVPGFPFLPGKLAEARACSPTQGVWGKLSGSGPGHQPPTVLLCSEQPPPPKAHP